MDIYGIRILKSQPLRLVLTVGGIALCVLLMLFLLAVYQGVEEGAVDYIRRNPADVWVLQQNAWNILRGSSILSSVHGTLLREVPGVESASPVLLILSGIERNGTMATVFLAGYDVSAPLGGPPGIVDGRSVQDDREIVLDEAFARKLGYATGDRLVLQEDTLTVCGLSSGTNALVIQYAFVTLSRAQALARFPGIVTCYLVRFRPGADHTQCAAEIRNGIPGVSVYTQTTFLDNNIQEMKSGFLPFLLVIAVLGTVVLTVIVALLLSIMILERRKELAILKAIGAPPALLPRIVVEQGLALCIGGAAIAAAAVGPLLAALGNLMPELSARTSPGEIIAVSLLVCVVGAVSSLVSARRLRTIYPLEAFQ